MSRPQHEKPLPLSYRRHMTLPGMKGPRVGIIYLLNEGLRCCTRTRNLAFLFNEMEWVLTLARIVHKEDDTPSGSRGINLNHKTH